MTLQALYCEACGSRDLVRVDDERYRCSHCGAAVLVSATRATPTAPRPAPVASRAWLFGAAATLLAAALALVLWQLSINPRAIPPTVIDPSTVTLSAATAVQALDRPTHRAKLLVMVSNRGKQPIRAPRVMASFYDGHTKLATASDFVQSSVLRPGESAPVLIDVPPAAGAATSGPMPRTIEVATPLQAVAVADGPVLQLAQARLVERDGRFKLAARVQVPPGRFPMQTCRASIVLLDASGGVVALGDGRCRARDVASGESTLIDASFVRISAAKVARWTYLIDYELMQAAPAPAVVVAPANRQQTVIAAAESLSTHASWDAQDLLRPTEAKSK